MCVMHFVVSKEISWARGRAGSKKFGQEVAAGEIDASSFIDSLSEVEVGHMKEYIKRVGDTRCFNFGQNPVKRCNASPDSETLNTIIKSSRMTMCKVSCDELTAPMHIWRWWSGYELLLTQGVPVIASAFRPHIDTCLHFDANCIQW